MQTKGISNKNKGMKVATQLFREEPLGAPSSDYRDYKKEWMGLKTNKTVWL